MSSSRGEHTRAGGRLRSPDDLTKPIDWQQRAVRPLLRKAGLLAHPDAARRHEANVPSVLAELAAEYRLDGRGAGFGEYVAARLASRLKQLDAVQHPELYDRHRGYQPDAAPREVPDDDHLPAAAQVFVDDGPPRAGIAQSLANAGIHPASQPGALRLVAGVEAGKTVNGRGAARALGAQGAATQALLHAQDVVAEERFRRVGPQGP